MHESADDEVMRILEKLHTPPRNLSSVTPEQWDRIVSRAILRMYDDILAPPPPLIADPAGGIICYIEPATRDQRYEEAVLYAYDDKGKPIHAGTKGISAFGFPSHDEHNDRDKRAAAACLAPLLYELTECHVLGAHRVNDNPQILPAIAAAFANMSNCTEYSRDGVDITPGHRDYVAMAFVDATQCIKEKISRGEPGACIW